jgi:pimeloyl-ACP methyl ester carboxylesterase
MYNFVLIPGAWLGGWVWKKITPSLQQEGHVVYPVTLTGMGERVHLATKDLGIETAIQDVLNVIKYNDIDSFVLVGHSFAGKVAAAVADRVPEKVRLLLYLDAFRPARNVRMPQGAFQPDEFGPIKEGQLAIPFTESIINAIGKDVKGSDREWLLAKGTPWPLTLANQPVTLSENFDSAKEAYIFCTSGGDNVDEIVAGKWGKLRGPYKVIDSGHWPMITKPDELVEDVLALAEMTPDLSYKREESIT